MTRIDGFVQADANGSIAIMSHKTSWHVNSERSCQTAALHPRARHLADNIVRANRTNFRPITSLVNHITIILPGNGASSGPHIGPDGGQLTKAPLPYPRRRCTVSKRGMLGLLSLLEYRKNRPVR